MTRDDLIREGFRSLCLSSDLFPYGIRIRHWFRVRDGAEAIEYSPRMGGHDDWSVVATNYDEQIAFHKSHGINITGRGEQWYDGNKTPLFAMADQGE